MLSPLGAGASGLSLQRNHLALSAVPSRAHVVARFQPLRRLRGDVAEIFEHDDGHASGVSLAHHGAEIIHASSGGIDSVTVDRIEAAVSVAAVCSLIDLDRRETQRFQLVQFRRGLGGFQREMGCPHALSVRRAPPPRRSPTNCAGRDSGGYRIRTPRQRSYSVRRRAAAADREQAPGALQRPPVFSNSRRVPFGISPDFPGRPTSPVQVTPFPAYLRRHVTVKCRVLSPLWGAPLPWAPPSQLALDVVVHPVLPGDLRELGVPRRSIFARSFWPRPRARRSEGSQDSPG